MTTHPTSRAFLAPLAVLVVAAGACRDAEPLVPATQRLDATSTAFIEAGGNEPLKVMTRNVYLGGNTGLVFGADFGDPVAVTIAAATVWAQVQASDIPGRAAAVVDEIASVRPHVVSLQEAFRFASTSGTVLDWLDALEAEIAVRGLPYHVAAVQSGTSATLPVSATELVSFTDRIALLVRDDVPTTSLDQGTYQAQLLLASAPPPIGDVFVRRGWIRLDIPYGGIPHHVVATHLETQGIRPIHDAQAQELVGSVAAGLDGVTIIAGDLNSDAEAEEGAPSWTPTYDLLRAAGFADAWLQASASETGEGFTCCNAVDLRNADPELDERIDFVLVRQERPGESGYHLSGAVAVDRLGEESGDRTDSGLWPSDHAGLVAALRLPTGLSTAGPR